jgi:RNA polymerase sigma-70 factor (ECF subfamily)
MDEYRTFYKRYKDKLFAYLMRMTGDYYLSSDIMQESFTRHLEHYGEQTPSISLLYTIARNALFDSARKQRYSTEPTEYPDDYSSNQENIILVREEYRQVLLAMQRLKKDERDIIALAISGELSYQEIASIAGISEANVKVKIHRARLKLRNILQRGNI